MPMTDADQILLVASIIATGEASAAQQQNAAAQLQAIAARVRCTTHLWDAIVADAQQDELAIARAKRRDRVR